jgi:hypothetical protein
VRKSIDNGLGNDGILKEFSPAFGIHLRGDNDGTTSVYPTFSRERGFAILSFVTKKRGSYGTRNIEEET